MLLNLPMHYLSMCAGGCYVEGVRLANAFRWRDSVGDYENRPGHYGDVWNYWSDDGFGYFEGLQVCKFIHSSLLIVMVQSVEVE